LLDFILRNERSGIQSEGKGIRGKGTAATDQLDIRSKTGMSSDAVDDWHGEG
jgi:hypothetical protein